MNIQAVALPTSDVTRWYSVPTLAALLGVSKCTVWRWSANGDAPPLIRIGAGSTRGRSTDWNAFLADPITWRAQHPLEAA
jgi:predicted DNA-binding transcriptional regulator AlpA